MAAGRGGRDGRRSGAGKVDDGGDEARGRDARILVRRRGRERSISCNGRRRRGISSRMVEEDGGGWGGGRRRTEEGEVERVFGAHGVRMGKREVERKGEPCSQGALVSNARKFTNLAHVSNLYYVHHSNISRLGIGR